MKNLEILFKIIHNIYNEKINCIYNFISKIEEDNYTNFIRKNFECLINDNNSKFYLRHNTLYCVNDNKNYLYRKRFSDEFNYWNCSFYILTKKSNIPAHDLEEICAKDLIKIFKNKDEFINFI